MNPFERVLGAPAGGGLRGAGLESLQVNVGLRCNQRCDHCHVAASPARTERMAWDLMEAVVRGARETVCRLVDITGGAPELHPDLRRFVAALRDCDIPVQVRTNFTVLLEPGLETLPAFFREHRVRLVGSLPCYLQRDVDAQRGEGTFERSLEAIRRLNALGYGRDPGLLLSLVFNPEDPALPPDQTALEAEFRRELDRRFGIVFTNLLALANMPIGRFLERLRARAEEVAYRRLLRDAFNPRTLDALMCRRQVNVGWDGTLHDCDFNLALGLPVDHDAPSHIGAFDAAALAARRIVTGEHCFGCTAGRGSSCGGALT